MQQVSPFSFFILIVNIRTYTQLRHGCGINAETSLIGRLASLKRPRLAMTIDKMGGFLKTSAEDGVDLASSQFVQRQISATLLKALKDRNVLSKILLKAPPASGKTSLLQEIAIKLQDETDLELYFICGTLHKADIPGLYARMATALRDVPPASVVFVDDAQLLYEAPELWLYLCKGSPVHVLAAASYPYEPSFQYASTPAVFGAFCSFFDVSPTLSECKSMESAILLDLEVGATLLDAVSSQVAVRPPTGLEKQERRVHLGVYRRLLEDLVARFRRQNPPTTILFAPDAFANPHLARCFAGLASMDFNPTLCKILRRFLCLKEPVDQLAFHDVDPAEVKKLIRSSILEEYKESGRIMLAFTSSLARRLFFRAVFPSKAPDMLYSNLQCLIVDAVKLFEVGFLQAGCDSSRSNSNDFPIEAVFQQAFSQAVSELLPPTVFFCAEYAGTARGRVDFLVGHWGIEMLILGRKLCEHEERFGAGGKYACDQIQEFCVVNFLPFDKSPELAKVKQRSAHISVVLNIDFTEATVHVEANGVFKPFNITLGQSAHQVINHRRELANTVCEDEAWGN